MRSRIKLWTILSANSREAGEVGQRELTVRLYGMAAFSAQLAEIKIEVTESLEGTTKAVLRERGRPRGPDSAIGAGDDGKSCFFRCEN